MWEQFFENLQILAWPRKRAAKLLTPSSLSCVIVRRVILLTMAFSAFTARVLIAVRASISVAMAMFEWERWRSLRRLSSQHSRSCKVASWSAMRVAVLYGHLVMKHSQSSLVLSLDTFGETICRVWPVDRRLGHVNTRAPWKVRWLESLQYPPWRRYILQWGNWAPPWLADTFTGLFSAWSTRYVCYQGRYRTGLKYTIRDTLRTIKKNTLEAHDTWYYKVIFMSHTIVAPIQFRLC